MSRDELIRMIIEVVKDYLESVDGGTSGPIGEKARLFGSGGLLDSLGLVTVVLDIEQRLDDELGVMVRIVDERAMSQKRSPFRYVGDLADYVLILLGEVSADVADRPAGCADHGRP
jgi:acyl carrier protein